VRRNRPSALGAEKHRRTIICRVILSFETQLLPCDGAELLPGRRDRDRAGSAAGTAGRRPGGIRRYERVHRRHAATVRHGKCNMSVGNALLIYRQCYAACLQRRFDSSLFGGTMEASQRIGAAGRKRKAAVWRAEGLKRKERLRVASARPASVLRKPEKGASSASDRACTGRKPGVYRTETLKI